MAKKNAPKNAPQPVDDPFANLPPLVDISNRARVLWKFAPGAAEKLLKAIEMIAICRTNEQTFKFLPDHQHEYNCWLKQCEQSAVRLEELAKLVYRHLRELTTPPLKFARLLPDFRYDDKSTNWPAFVAEMQRIEDAALVKHFAGDSVPVTLPEQTAEPPITLDKFKQGTQPQKAANGQDRVAHGTSLPGSKNPSAVLTPAMVDAIRDEFASGGVTRTAIARKYNVTPTTISNIINRKCWK